MKLRPLLPGRLAQRVSALTAVLVCFLQKLLLDELNLTRTCNTLLVPEADEDVRWVNDKTLGVKGKTKADSDSDESDDDAAQDKYLADQMKYSAGHFACDLKWQVQNTRNRDGPYPSPRCSHDGTPHTAAKMALPPCNNNGTPHPAGTVLLGSHPNLQRWRFLVVRSTCVEKTLHAG